jgi:hypothetical protein
MQMPSADNLAEVDRAAHGTLTVGKVFQSKGFLEPRTTLVRDIVMTSMKKDM